MAPTAQHLHTYFLFPFSIDRESILAAHADVWRKREHWIDGLDQWIASHKPPFLAWKRNPYRDFSLDSPAYQDMVFFHPIIRKVFFDTTGQAGSREALVRCYAMRPPEGGKLWMEASDRKGRSAAVEVTDLRLFLFVNGIGILSIGVEARDLPIAEALWINEALRKLYPASGRQLREGRTPDRLALVMELEDHHVTVTEETFEKCDLVGFQPPLATTIQSLLYFCDFAAQEYELVLDERMIVYTYLQLDPASLPEGFVESRDYQVLLSRVLFVDQHAPDFRYDPEYLDARFRTQLYRRWAHEGTYYGFTSYSSITVTIGEFETGDHSLDEGFVIHRMFDTRYYLMALVALFYRATLLDFTEWSALVTRRLYHLDGRLTPENMRVAEELRAEFLHFSNYWYFRELANKEEEAEHFAMQCQQYRIDSMKTEIEDEIETLDTSLQQHYQFRNTEAINRVAMLSLMLGAGAMLTGFFGMNFGGAFRAWFLDSPDQFPVIQYLSIGAVLLFSIGAMVFGVYVVALNWPDYREILDPRERERRSAGSLRRE